MRQLTQVGSVNARTAKLMAQGISFPTHVETKKNRAIFHEKAEKYHAQAEKISKEIEGLRSFIVDLKNPECPDDVLENHLMKIAPKKLKKTINKCLLTGFPEEELKNLWRHPRILFQLKNRIGQTPLDYYLENQQRNLNAVMEIASLYSNLASNHSLSIDEESCCKKIATLKASTNLPFAFDLNYILNEGIQQTDTPQAASDVLKLQQLQDFYMFLNSPSFSKEFIFGKFQELDHEIKEALSQAIWAACYMPDELFFADSILAKNPQMLLDCKNGQGSDVIVQIMNHYKAKITLQRFKPKLVHFAQELEATNDEAKQFNLFRALPEFARKDLAQLVWLKYRTEYDAKFDHVNDGLQRIIMCPSILIEKSYALSTKPPPSFTRQDSIITNYMQILDRKIDFDIRTGAKQFASKQQMPRTPISCVATQLTASPKTSHSIPPSMRVAMITAEFAGVISMGGLAPAVAGIARGYGPDRVCVILPKYDVINPKLILQEKEKLQLQFNGKIHRVFKAKVNGIPCYFIEDDLFNVGYDEHGKPNNIYEGKSDLEVKRRWTHFQSLSADFVYKLSKREKNPVHLVHIHDAQTGLVPKILATRYYDEWKAGTTPATVFTFHNNNNPMPFDSPQALDLLTEIDLPPVYINSFIDGLETSDMNTTVSETFAKEVQTALFGKRMQRYTIINAAKGKLIGIINGNTEGWNPKTDPQLKHWVSQDGVPLDLSYGPDDEDLSDKIKLIRQQLVDYLKSHHLGHFDPAKPIFLYVGRYDAYQKGIDKLPIIMEEVLVHGGQFICIGLEPDPKADQILKQMEEFARQRNNQGVCIIRDFKRPDGRLYWQQGNVDLEDTSGVQGFGRLLRAATDVGTFPSMFEPCGLVQGEMHQMGIETLATATGGFIDTIFTEGPNRNGYLFPRLYIWESEEQSGIIRETVRKAVRKVHHQLDALYNNDLTQLMPYLTQKRVIMRNAARSTWNSTFDGSLSPIDRYQLVYAKAFENRQARGIIHLDMHALGSPSCPLQDLSKVEVVSK